MRGRILIAEIRGFCSGVERAVQLVERAAAEGPFPVRVLHEIVHNESVVEEFRKKGVLFAEELDPAWEGGTPDFQRPRGLGEGGASGARNECESD